MSPTTNTQPTLKEQGYTREEALLFIRGNEAEAARRRDMRLQNEKGVFRKLGEAIVKPALATGTNIQYGLTKAASNLAGAVGADNTKRQFDSEVNRLTTKGNLGGFVKPDDTAGKVVGNALQTAALPIGGGTVANTARQGLTGAILSAARTGAIGGAQAGALTGGGASLAQGNTDAGKVVGDTLGGAVLGAGTGAVLGGALGGVSKAFTRATRGPTDDVLMNRVTPEARNFSTREAADLVNAGRITPPTPTKAAQYVLSPRERETVLKFKDVIAKDPIDTARNITNKIESIDEDVGSFLKSNNAIFNKGELRNSLRAAFDDLDDITVPEPRIAKAKDDIVERFVESIEKNDMQSLWQARKAFDQQYKRIFNGSPTLQKEVQKRLRDSVQDFIATRTPEGKYKASMGDMRALFELRDLVNRKGVSSRGRDQLVEWARKHPRSMWVLAALGTTGILGAGVGVANAGAR